MVRRKAGYLRAESWDRVAQQATEINCFEIRTAKGQARDVRKFLSDGTVQVRAVHGTIEIGLFNPIKMMWIGIF